MDLKKRKPDFLIEVVRPSYTSRSTGVLAKSFDVYGPYKQTIVAQFSSNPNTIGKTKSNACVSYHFAESLATVSDNFSLELTLEEDHEGKTWYDKLKLMDLVFIREFGEARFCGYIRERRYRGSMSGGKPNRRILISGGSLGELLQSFKLVIDQFLYQGNSTAYTASQKLKVMLSQQQGVGSKVSNILKTIYSSFFELVLKMGSVNAAGIGIKSILDYHVDYQTGLSNDLTIQYPLALSLYQTGASQSIWDIWMGLVDAPVNELFGRWDPKLNKFQLIFRRSPFDAGDWKELPINKIPSIIIEDTTVGNSINEVFTYYLGTLPGSGISKRKSMVLGQDGYGHSAIIDKEKWKMYGYRPLIVEYRYFDKNEIESFQSAILRMHESSEDIKNWYMNNDEFLSGTLDIMTIDPHDWRGTLNNPRSGERIEFLDGEFYIEASEHSWSFLSPMKTKLSLSRGYLYEANGSQKGEIENLGIKMKTIIRDAK